MKKNILVLALLVFFSCGKKEDNNDASSEKEFDMYQMSEMSILMEQIYVNNRELKSRIEKKNF